jgi:flagellar hook-associated protein 2
MSVSITTSSIISSTYTSGQTRVSGLVSDFDFDAIIEAQLQSEGISKTSLEEQLAEQEQYLTSLEELDAYLLALQESLESLDSLDEFSSKIATSTDDGIEVIADASSANGYHEVEVGQLAQNDVIVNTGTGFTSTSESIADEDTVFSFSYNGDTVTLDVPSGTSLQELVDMINSDPESRECVTAYLIDDGDAYYFAMSGQDMGEDYAITLEDTGTLTGFGTDQFSRTRTAQNALLKVDGFPAAEDEWIERTTNSVDDVISGLTLELQDVTDGVARINVSTDTETISSNISSVVDDMNVILQYLQIMTGKIEDPYGDESDIYVDTSNYTLNTMYSTLKDVLSSEGIGFTTYDADTGLGDTYSSLSQIGIYTDTDEDSSTFGLLLIDDDALEEALQNDSDAVAELFSIENDCTVDSSDLTFVSLLEDVTQAGDYEVSYEVQDGELVSVTVDGEEASIDGNQITVMSGDAKGLSLLINQDVDGSYSSAVHVKEGKLPELVATLDGMTDSYDGTLQHLIDAAEESLETTSDQIDSETDRLEDLETRLIEKYSTLQSTLSYYAELQESLDSLTASLDSSD